MESTNLHPYRKNIFSATLGILIASISSTAIQFLLTKEWGHLPSIMKYFPRYALGALSIASYVIIIYSMFRLGKVLLSKNIKLPKVLTTLAIGVFLTALTQSIMQYLFLTAPSFYSYEKSGHSLAYCIATNFGLHVTIAAEAGSVVFTVYAAYRLGKAVLANLASAGSR